MRRANSPMAPTKFDGTRRASQTPPNATRRQFSDSQFAPPPRKCRRSSRRQLSRRQRRLLPSRQKSERERLAIEPRNSPTFSDSQSSAAASLARFCRRCQARARPQPRRQHSPHSRQATTRRRRHCPRRHLRTRRASEGRRSAICVRRSLNCRPPPTTAGRKSPRRRLCRSPKRRPTIIIIVKECAPSDASSSSRIASCHVLVYASELTVDSSSSSPQLAAALVYTCQFADDARARADSTSVKTAPIQLPELANFNSGGSGLLSSARAPLPFASAELGSSASSLSPRVSVGRPRRPNVVEWGDEDVEAIRGGPLPSVSTSSSSLLAQPTSDIDGGGSSAGGGGGGVGGGDGDSALGFGASLGTPPPGFAEAFGLSGGGAMPLGETTATSAEVASSSSTSPPSTTVATTTARAQTPPPPLPEMPLIIPQDSGLRPSRPPAEFTGGFGSGRGGGALGGSFGGPALIGGGGGGFDDAAATGAALGKTRGGKPRKPVPEPELKGERASYKRRVLSRWRHLAAEDFFTGDSALTPNVRGPTGDGYGPPLLGTGGSAAASGSAPSQPPPPPNYRGGPMEVTENTPTTVGSEPFAQYERHVAH